MDSPNYDFKYSSFYPLMIFAIYSILLVIGLFVINSHFNIFKLDTWLFIIIIVFLLEAVVRFNASREIAIPRLIFILEAGLFLLVLRFLIGGFHDIGLWVIWALTLLAWYNIHELMGYFDLFSNDSIKVYGRGTDSKDIDINNEKNRNKDNSGENNKLSFNKSQANKWSFDEFRRLLDYPAIWKKILGNIYFSNIPLLLIWAFSKSLNSWLILGSILFLLLEIFLLAQLYLEKKSLDWYIEGIERPRIIRQAWYSFIIIILIIVIIFALILPYNYNPLPIGRIVNWFNSQIPELTPREMPLQEQGGIEKPSLNFNQQAGQEESGLIQLIFLILQILLVGSFVFIIMAFLLFILKQEYGKVKNIPDFIKSFFKYTLRLIKGLFSRVKELNVTINSFRERIRKEQRDRKTSQQEVFELKNLEFSGELPSMIITIYQGMLKLLALKGEKKEKGQTPYEYSYLLGRKFSNIKDEIRQITDLYVEVVYSNHKLGGKIAETVKTLWKKLRKGI